MASDAQCDAQTEIGEGEKMGRKAEGIVLLKDSDETEQRIQWDSSMVQCSGNFRYSDNSQ